MLSRRTALAGAGVLATACTMAGAAHAIPRAIPRAMAATPLSRDLAWWRERHAAKLQEKARRGRIDLVFLGDSITQQYEMAGPPAFLDYRAVWDRFYGDRRALNLGFKGDATSHLLWRIENGEVAGIAPRVAVVLIGANNFGRLHWSSQDTVQGIAAIAHTLRDRLPATQLMLLSVLPSDRGAWVDESAAQTNRALAARFATSGTDGARFFDLSVVFLRDGHIDLAMYADPKLRPPAAALHPDAAGQARMAQALEPTIAALMGDREHGA